MINSTIPDNVNGKTVYITLSPDQSLNPFTCFPPIVWTGYLSNEKISFIQTDRLAHSIWCFDWMDFPKEFSHLKVYIAELIDKEIKIMD